MSEHITRLKISFLNKPYLRLSDLCHFITVIWLDHATFHETELIFHRPLRESFGKCKEVSLEKDSLRLWMKAKLLRTFDKYYKSHSTFLSVMLWAMDNTVRFTSIHPRVFSESISLIFSGNIWSTDKPSTNFRILISRVLTWVYQISQKEEKSNRSNKSFKTMVVLCQLLSWSEYKYDMLITVRLRKGLTLRSVDSKSEHATF